MDNLDNITTIQWQFLDSKKYESLDYDTNYNSILVDEMRHKGYKFVFQQVRSSFMMTSLGPRLLSMKIFWFWSFVLLGHPSLGCDVCCGGADCIGGLLHWHHHWVAGQLEVQSVEGVDWPLCGGAVQLPLHPPLHVGRPQRNPSGLWQLSCCLHRTSSRRIWHPSGWLFCNLLLDPPDFSSRSSATWTGWRCQEWWGSRPWLARLLELFVQFSVGLLSARRGQWSIGPYSKTVCHWYVLGKKQV